MDSQLSKSEKKRRAKGIEELVMELANLPPGEIASLPCEREVRLEIAAAGKLKGGSRKRQLKYATKLLRDRPTEELYNFLAKKKGSDLKVKREFQQLEHFRNLLMDEAVREYEEKMHNNGFLNTSEPADFLDDSETIRLVSTQLPEVDRTKLRNSAMQFARTRNRKFSRELFRIMKAAAEKARFSQKQEENHGI